MVVKKKSKPAPARKQSYFSGVSEAQESGGGLYFLEGNYRVEVQKVYMKSSRHKVDFFMIEAKILKSSNPKRKRGQKPTQMIKMTLDAALGNIKNFALAVLGSDTVDEEDIEALVDDDNPAEGTIVDLECVNIDTQSGGEFTLHKYYPEGHFDDDDFVNKDDGEDEDIEEDEDDEPAKPAKAKKKVRR